MNIKQSLFSKTTIISFIIIVILAILFEGIFLFSFGGYQDNKGFPFVYSTSPIAPTAPPATFSIFYLILNLVIYYVIAVAISIIFRKKN